MLILGSELQNRPVLGLQTSFPVAQLDRPVISPYSLKIFAFQLSGPRLDRPHDSYLLVKNIREISPMGFIIDSHDDIIGKEDVVKLKELLELGFSLNGIKVIDQANQKIGKVVNFSLNLQTMAIEQLIIERPFFKALVDPELMVHRSKIVEITNEKIIIKEEKEKPKATQAVNDKLEPVGEFVNPFRKDPELENSTETNA